MARGDNIQASDYNGIRSKIVSILGTGTGQRGYGQPLYSSAATTGQIITKDDWDRLRADIVNVKVHQDGILPPIITLSERAIIEYGTGHPNTNYNSITDQTVLARFNVALNQSTITAVGTKTRTGTWSALCTATLTVTFNGGYTVTNADGSTFTATGSDNARHFFNSGGKIRFSSSRAGGSSTAHNAAWTSLLNSIGTFSFGAITPAIRNFYGLTTAYQTVYQTSQSVVYLQNYVQIEAKCNCTGANNSTGTANTIDFRISWVDAFTDLTPPFDDFVDGTLSLVVDEFKAAGVLVQGGDFSITSPTYTLGEITTTDAASSLYAVIPNKSSVAEGSSVTFTVYTANVADGTTLYWSFGTSTTADAADFTDSAITGTVTINSGTGTIVRNIASDFPDSVPDDQFTIAIRTDSTSGPIKATSSVVVITDAPAIVPAGTTTYSVVNSSTSWTVPAGYNAVRVTALGGGGGGGGCDTHPGYVGAPGAMVTSIITVSPGDVLTFNVGGGGGAGRNDQGSAPGGAGGLAPAGMSGGSGSNAGPTPYSGSGGGGGGASSVYKNGSPVVVAGGGGGGGGGGNYSGGRGPQGLFSATTAGTNGDSKGGDGAGAGGGGGGYPYGGRGGQVVGGDSGAYSGTSGQALSPSGVGATVVSASNGGTNGVRGVRQPSAGGAGYIVLEYGPTIFVGTD